jgi:hypothetical protein
MSLKRICKYCVPFSGGTEYTSENATYGLIADTNVVESGSAAPPTINEVNGGGVALAMSQLPSNSLNVLQLFMGDVLPFPVANIERVWFEMKATGLTTATTVLVGVCGTSDDTLANINTAAWLVASGGTGINAEVRDGSINNLSASTANTISGSVFQLCCIDFTKGVNDVRFHVDDNSRALHRQCQHHTFSVSNALTQNLQFIARVQKLNSSDRPTLFVRNLEIEYRSN